jgi:peptide/nickel transport system ATP-binding protein
MKIIECKGLKKYFPVARSFLERLITKDQRYVKAVDNIDLYIKEGEILSLVGESGSGKSTTGRLLIRLLEPTEGRIIFQGRDITYLKGEELRLLRRDMQIVYQDPYASLNPRMRIGDIIKEPLEIHNITDTNQAREAAIEMLERVGLSPAEKFYNLYPRNLSGGQRQRVAFARALITRPKFLVADEPVSMIDLSLRASLLDMMLRLKNELGLSILFITHDLSVAYYVSNRIAIMYLGRIIELGDRKQVFKNPLHPYTQALLKAVPKPKPGYRGGTPLRGEIPSPIDIPPGCRFHPRCPHTFNRCKTTEPDLIEMETNHYVACHLYE